MLRSILWSESRKCKTEVHVSLPHDRQKWTLIQLGILQSSRLSVLHKASKQSGNFRSHQNLGKCFIPKKQNPQMDSQTAVETFKFKSTQTPSFNIIETPIHYKPFATPTDLSFSTYLKNEQPSNSKHPPQTTLDDSEINVFDAQKYFSDSNDSKEIKLNLGSSNNLNLNLNLNLNPSDSVSRISSVSSSVDKHGRNFRVRSFHSTPTASSEASWNSQIGLLSKQQGGVLRNVSVDHHSKKRSVFSSSSSSSSSSSRGKWFFCRKCPCAGKKSLQVIEEQSCDNYNRNGETDFQHKTHSHKTNERMVQLQKMSNISLKSSPERHQQKVGFNSSRILSENNFILSNDVLLKRVVRASSNPRPNTSSFSFPVLKDMPMRTNVKTSFEESARESLEVFQPPPHMSNSRKNIEDDVASDASSDLFEIESFSTQTPSNNYRKRDSLDEASTLHSGRFGVDNNFSSSIDHDPITPRTECYAPSEASIDWSVTTAEGFDKSSVTNFSAIHVSEYEDSSTISRLRSMEKYGVQGAMSSSLNWKKGGGGNGILGCRHEKAVNVGPNPVKFVQESSPSILPLISTSGHVNGGASRPPKPNMQHSSRAHARLSLAFAA